MKPVKLVRVEKNFLENLKKINISRGSSENWTVLNAQIVLHIKKLTPDNKINYVCFSDVSEDKNISKQSKLTGPSGK